MHACRHMDIIEFLAKKGAKLTVKDKVRCLHPALRLARPRTGLCARVLGLAFKAMAASLCSQSCPLRCAMHGLGAFCTRCKSFGCAAMACCLAVQDGETPYDVAGKNLKVRKLIQALMDANLDDDDEEDKGEGDDEEWEDADEEEAKQAVASS